MQQGEGPSPQHSSGLKSFLSNKLSTAARGLFGSTQTSHPPPATRSPWDSTAASTVNKLPLLASGVTDLDPEAEARYLLQELRREQQPPSLMHGPPRPHNEPASRQSRAQHARGHDQGGQADDWGSNGAWGTGGSDYGSSSRVNAEAGPSRAAQNTLYDVPMERAIKTSDAAQAQLQKLRHPPSPQHASAAVAADDDDDEVEVVGSMRPKASAPLRRPSPVLDDEPRRHVIPPSTYSQQQPHPSHRRQADYTQPTVTITTPSGTGASGQGGFGTSNSSRYPPPPSRPLKGTRATPASMVASAAQQRQRNEEIQAEARRIELNKRKKASNASPFAVGRNTLDGSTPASSHKSTPTTSQYLSNPYPPPSSRNGGASRLSAQPAATPSRPSGSRLAHAKQETAPRGPAGNSRDFAAGDDAYLTKKHVNRESNPKPELPSFKKNDPPPPAVKTNGATGSRDHAIELDDDDVAGDGLSQQSEEITTFEEDADQRSSARKAAPPSRQANGKVTGLFNVERPLDLRDLPRSPPKSHPVLSVEDDVGIPIRVPKPGSVRPGSVRAKMAGPAGTPIDKFLVPTATTRGQRKQQAGDVIVFPEGFVSYTGCGKRKCRLSINDRRIHLDTIAFETIVKIPLCDVREIQFSKHNSEKVILKFLLQDDPPRDLRDFREVLVLWTLPSKVPNLARDLTKALDRIPDVPALAGKPHLKLTPLTDKQVERETMISSDEEKGKRPAPVTRKQAKAVIDQTPISIDDSDEEAPDFPDLRPPTQAPKSEVARGKERERVRPATRDASREPPPANPNELMCNWPPTGRPEVSILRGDFHRTTHKDEYLNDTIIDWGIKRVPALRSIPTAASVTNEFPYRVAWALERANNPHLDDDVYIFSSFLYHKLTEKSAQRTGFDPWENVKSWTTKKSGKDKKELKIDLFAKKFIVVPINESYHWYLAIVVNPLAVLQPPPPKAPRPKPVPRPPTGIKNTRQTASQNSEPMVIDDSDHESPSRPKLAETESELLVVETAETAAAAGAKSDGKSAEQLLDEKAVAAAPEPEAPVKIESPAVSADSDAAKKTQERQQGYVLILDSLGGGTMTSPAKVLSKYLRSEGVEHKGWSNEDPTCFTTLDLKKVDVPRQLDESSCGVFLLHYIEIFLHNPAKAVEFILAHNRPKRTDFLSHSEWQVALKRYESERDTFWVKPELATKRAGYKRKLLRLEQEYLAYKDGREPPPEEQEPSPDLETAAQTDRPPQTGLETLADAAAATADSSAARAPAADTSAPDALAKATSDESDVAPSPALITSQRAPKEAPSAEPSGSEEPILPPSPEPPEHADGDVPQPAVDSMDMVRLKSSLPHQDVDEIASHVSATPDSPPKHPPTASPEPAAREESPPGWRTAGSITDEGREVGFPPAPLMLQPRPSEEEVALQTQPAAQTPPSPQATVIDDDGVDENEPGVLTVDRSRSVSQEVIVVRESAPYAELDSDGIERLGLSAKKRKTRRATLGDGAASDSSDDIDMFRENAPASLLQRSPELKVSKRPASPLLPSQPSAKRSKRELPAPQPALRFTGPPTSSARPASTRAQKPPSGTTAPSSSAEKRPRYQATIPMDAAADDDDDVQEVAQPKAEVARPVPLGKGKKRELLPDPPVYDVDISDDSDADAGAGGTSGPGDGSGIFKHTRHRRVPSQDV